MKFSFPAFLVWLWTCTIFVDAYWSTSDTIETKEYLLSTDFSTWKEKYFAAKLWKLLDSVQDFPICKCPSDDTFRNTQELFYFELLKIECDCEKVSVNNNAHVWIDGLKADEIKTAASALILASHYDVLMKEEKVAVLDKIYNRLISLDQDSTAFSNEIYDSLFLCEFFQMDSDAANLLQLIGDKSQLFLSYSSEIFDPSILFYVKLCSKKPIKFSNSNVLKVVQQLQYSTSNDVETKLDVYRSLSAIKSLKNSPIFFSYDTQRIVNNANNRLDVGLVDIMGINVHVSKMEIALTNVKDGAVIINNLVVQNNSIDFSNFNLLPGVYSAEFVVFIDEKRGNLFTNKLSFIVPQQNLFIDNVKLGISESKSISSFDLLPQSSESTISGILVSAISEYIHIEYDLKQASLKPTYSSVIFSNDENDSVAYFPLSMEENGNFKYKLVVNLAEDMEKFNHICGNYTVSILIGDVAVFPSIKWLIGSVFIKFPPTVEQKLPLYSRSLLHASDTTLKALPEIEHLMRPPAKQAGDFAAQIFTVFVLIPLGGVCFYWYQASEQRLMFKSISSGVLVLGWFSLLSLYTGYWLGIEGFSFYSTIKYLCVLAPIIFILGRNTLGNF